MASINRDEISRLELLHAAHPDGLVFPHLADAYRRAGRYAQAESVLDAGLRRHSEYSSAHVVLGRLRLDQGKHDEAERAFRRVLELDPQNQVALEALGRVSLEQGRLEEALEQFRRLSRIKPTEEVRDRISDLEERVDELRQEESHRNGGESPVHMVSTVDAGHGNGRNGHEPADSEGVPADVLQLPEPGEVVTETMAELYTRQGLHERAAAVYRQLLTRRPGDPRLQSRLDAAEAASGRIPTTSPATSPAPASQDVSEAEIPQSAVSQSDVSEPDVAEPEAITVREHFAAILSWRSSEPPPAPPTEAEAEPEPAEPQLTVSDSPDVEAADDEIADPEPWASAPVSQVTRTAEGATDGSAVAESAGGERSVDRQPETSGASDATARSLIAISDMLVGLLEYRDPFFRGSSSLTRLLAENVAEEMGMSGAERIDLALAAVLRDLGRLAMGGRLVSQRAQQTSEARRKIERHVDLALQLLEGIELPRRVQLAVRHHHERWDGAGYPDGLAGESIPPLARVLAVVDSFAAMVSPRSYRLPRKVPDAAKELRAAAGTQYDPEVVDALMRVLARQDRPRQGFVQRPHVLLVNPDQPGAVVTAAKLCSAGYLAEVSLDPEAARERLRRIPVAGIIVSAEVGEEAAAAFVRDLRVDPLFAALPVVVVEAEDVALRVRLLESGADVCFPPDTSYGELQGTLGGLIRRTIRAGRGAQGGDGEDGGEQEAPWLALQGDVEDFPLTWLLQVMKYDSRTAAIGIRTAEDDGAIYLQKGDAVHAQIRGGLKGEAALRRMLGWGKGRFTVQPDAKPREQTIQTSIMHLLLTQAVDEDHAAAGIFGTVSDEA